MNFDIDAIQVNHKKTIKETMKIIDEGRLGIAFVVDDEGKLIGSATDGDIRRAISKGLTINTEVAQIMNKEPIVTKGKHEIVVTEKLTRMIPLGSSLKIPVLDGNGKIMDLVFLYSKEKPIISKTPLKKESVKSVLVIGGAGYLGSVLTKKLLEKGYRVRVLDNLLFGDEGITGFRKNERFEFIQGDVRNISDITKSLKDMDAVVALAAIVGDPACKANPEETLETNYFSTKVLAEICKYGQVNRFLFASTCSVYGATSGEDLLGEESPLNPVSLYAEARINSENVLLEMADDNFAPTILRMPTLFGLSPRMRFDLVVNLLTAKAVVENEVTVFGGQQWRPFLHLEDAADAYIKCLEAPINEVRGQVFNVGSNENNYKIIEIAEMIKKSLTEVKIRVDEKNVDRRNYKVNFDKFKKLFNFKAKKSILDGVDEISKIDIEVLRDYKNKKYANYSA